MHAIARGHAPPTVNETRLLFKKWAFPPHSLTNGVWRHSRHGLEEASGEVQEQRRRHVAWVSNSKFSAAGY